MKMYGDHGILRCGMTKLEVVVDRAEPQSWPPEIKSCDVYMAYEILDCTLSICQILWPNLLTSNVLSMLRPILLILFIETTFFIRPTKRTVLPVIRQFDESGESGREELCFIFLFCIRSGTGVKRVIKGRRFKFCTNFQSKTSW
jgi:hypothetical protein